MSLSKERERLLGRLTSRKTREREGLFLVEGIRSVDEALATGAKLKFAVVSPRLLELGGGSALRDRLAAARVDTVEIDDAELAALSDTEAPQGVLAVCPEPAVHGELPAGPLLVIDGVQDPGNVGTLIRAAAAFGLGAVVVLDGTVDPYNPKSVRAAAGGFFRTRVVRTRWDDVADALRSRGPLLVADMAGEDVATAAPARNWALVVGGEGAGARGMVRAAAAATVAIPMPGGSESLNAGVAGAILLYALTRKSARV